MQAVANALPIASPIAPPMDAAPPPPPAVATLDAPVIVEGGRDGMVLGMRRRCEQALGDEFAPVYKYMKQSHMDGVPPGKVQKQLEAMVGQAKVGYCMLVEQLIFLELVN